MSSDSENEELERMHKELVEVKRELGDYKHQMTVQGKRAIDAEDALVSMREKKDDIESQLEEARAQIDSYENTMQELRAENEDLRMQLE